MLRAYKDKFEWAKLCAQPEATRAHPTGEAEGSEDRTGCGIYTALREFLASADPARFRAATEWFPAVPGRDDLAVRALPVRLQFRRYQPAQSIQNQEVVA